MTAFSRLRTPALICSLALIACALISLPFAQIGICDDWSYILSAQHLAATGHIAYNGWATAMLGSQLYLGAAFVKLFGHSFTAVRMSTLFLSGVLAFFLQRTLVRSGIFERNATLGTLALVLSPLYMFLSVTFMTDIQGLLATVICLYGCLRALQAPSSRSAIAWIAFAIISNGLLGSARQIAWLGILVMVPSTLWLLRTQRRVLLAGSLIATAAALGILCAMHWFNHQPYSIPEHLTIPSHPVHRISIALLHAFLDLPFLLLPVAILFLVVLRLASRRTLIILALAAFGYALLSFRTHLHPNPWLDPTTGDWLSATGISGFSDLKGTPPRYLTPAIQIAITLLSIGGLFCIVAAIARPAQSITGTPSSAASWKQLGVFLGPFSLAYIVLLIPRSAISGAIYDRYLLGLLPFLLLCILRWYQEHIHPRLPSATLAFIALFACYAITYTHNQFAFYRARFALASELSAAGIPATSVDTGWELNSLVELQNADHINDFRIRVPANAYKPYPKPQFHSCGMTFYTNFPHILPRYAVSFDPAACYGPAPFAPMTYSRWPANPGTLYVVYETQP